jgi:hypothetical protein
MADVTMPDLATLDLDMLLRDGRAAALAGDMYTARTLFRHACELAPTCADAWVGLGAAMPVLAEKRAAFQRALAIDPAHGEAQASAAYVERLIAQGHTLAPGRQHTQTDDVVRRPELAEAARECCYLHPERETGLRCVQCSRPICGACARIAAVGQLCPPCRSQRRPVNYKVGARHVLTASLAVAVGAGLIGALLSGLAFGGLYIGIMLGLLVGEGSVRLSDRLTHGKRGRPMQLAVAGGLAFGTLLGACASTAGVIIAAVGVQQIPLLLAEAGPAVLIGPALMPSAWIYMIAAAATAVARLR